MIKLPPRYANIVKVFSAGGMADTLLCLDSNLNRNVVVKSLKSGIEPHRLLDELSALSAIRSRYVVQVLDVIFDNGQIVGFVEEHLPGADLVPCDPTKHSAVDALKMLYPIAAGISEIHEHGRIHRDIKPDNMKYDQDGYLKIFDFGLAKISESPGTKALYFTDGFTAPECFRKNEKGMHTYGYPVDVYAFGCVAVWLLNCGVIPSEMTGLVPSLPAGFDFATLPLAVDARTAALLMTCLASDPATRPTIAECRRHISAELLRDKHKMVLTSRTKQYVLDKAQRGATISGVGTSASSSISVAYTGTDFVVTRTTGTVAINNAMPNVGQRITGSTVIVLGAAGERRISIACDVSHPEVML